MLALSAGGFVADVARVHSIIALMQEAVDARIKTANAEDEKIDTCVLESFSGDLGWLFDTLSTRLDELWGELEREGVPMPKRI